MDELDRIIADGRETHGVEFKGPMDWGDDATKATVTKACLAMANKRDGGYLVIGMVPDPTRPGHHVVQGLSSEQGASFDPDRVMAKVNAHAQPSIDLSLLHRDIAGSRVFAIIIREFLDYPVMCSQAVVVNGKTVVAKGAILIRSRRIPESTTVQTAEDFRDLVDLSIEKGLARFEKLRAITAREAVSPPADVAELFRAQLKGL